MKRYLNERLKSGLEMFPAVGIVGLRQSGKTTLAKQLTEGRENSSVYLDLENPEDLNLLDDPLLFLREHQDDLVVFDEIHHKPELFPVLRSEIDRHRKAGRFLILGSGSPEVLRQGSESLAGRIEYHRLFPFNVWETANTLETNQLWLRGGLPLAALAESGEKAFRWLAAITQSYYQKDLPQLGLTAPAPLTQRLISLIASQQGELLNVNNLSRALDLSATTVHKYLDILEASFLILRLQPYHANLKKRLVKTPKIYLTDTGILHHALGLETFDGVLRHIKQGASFETFVITQILSQLPPTISPYFFRTADGSEIDLLLEKNGELWAAIEIKSSSRPNPTKGNTMAFQSLKAKHNLIVAPVGRDYSLKENLRVLNVKNVREYLESK